MRLLFKLLLVILVVSSLGFLGWFIYNLISLTERFSHFSFDVPLALIALCVWVFGGQGQGSVFE